jgi:hypothetical protein
MRRPHAQQAQLFIVGAVFHFFYLALVQRDGPHDHQAECDTALRHLFLGRRGILARYDRHFFGQMLSLSMAEAELHPRGSGLPFHYEGRVTSFRVSEMLPYLARRREEGWDRALN